MIQNLKLRLILGAVALTAVLASTSHCGDLPARERDRILREARELVRVGKHEDALDKLDRLYGRSPDDDVVVKALFNLLVKVKRFERAEQIMTRYLGRRQNDVRGLEDLASLYFKADKKSSGMDLIERIVNIAPQEQWTYEIGLQVLLRNDMHDEALAMISKAREALGDSALLAIDAGRIYEDRKQYDMATRQYLLAGTTREIREDVAADYILRIAKSDEARQSVIKSLERAKVIEAFQETAGRVLWEVHLLGGDCQRSFEELSEAVDREQEFARFLPVFARRSSEGGCYRQCSEAYALAARHTENKSKIPAYLLEKGRCEVKAGLAQEALTTYAAVVSDYPSSIWATEALLARGHLYRDMGRLQEAAAEADKVISESVGDDRRCDAILFKGDCLVNMGNLEDAFETYDLVEADWQARYAQEAFFNLGEVSFYRSDFDKALSYYNVTLRQFPDEARANDAIDRLLLLKNLGSGDSYTPQLKDFAVASLLRRQGKTREALALFREIAEKAGAGALKIESLRNMSEIYADRGAFESAVRTYKLIAETLDTYWSASALEAIGDIYRSLGRTDDAIKAYEDVILRFPESVSAGEARRKLELTKRNSKADF